MHECSLFLYAYLLGSIPTALWVSKLFFGIDIREHGSMNMGATNTFRVLGPAYGVFVLVVDMLKGWLAVGLAADISEADWMGDEMMLWQLMLGLTAVVAHIFPVFASFKGGKGIATLFGMVLSIEPMMGVIGVLVFIFVAAVTRYISLASLLGVLVFTLCIFFAVSNAHIYLRWFSAIAALLVCIMHLPNLRRLLNGTENKFRFPKK